MFRFTDYTWEIFTISKALHVDIGVAYAMLKADIASGCRDNTGDVDLGSFDVIWAHARFEQLNEDEKKEAYAEWHDFVSKCYEEAVKAYPDREKLDRLAAEYRAGQYDVKPEPEVEA